MLQEQGQAGFIAALKENLSVQKGDDRLNELAAAFARSGQGLDSYDDILVVQWGKLLVLSLIHISEPTRPY